MSGRDQTSVVTRVLDFLKDRFKISLFLIFNSILPLTDVVTDSCACASVAMTAFQNVLKDEDKKTELELTDQASHPVERWGQVKTKRRRQEKTGTGGKESQGSRKSSSWVGQGSTHRRSWGVKTIVETKVYAGPRGKQTIERDSEEKQINPTKH